MPKIEFQSFCYCFFDGLFTFILTLNDLTNFLKVEKIGGKIREIERREIVKKV